MDTLEWQEGTTQPRSKYTNACACATPTNSGIHTDLYCGPRYKIQIRAQCSDFRITDMTDDKRIAICYTPANAFAVCEALNNVEKIKAMLARQQLGPDNVT